jgi:hypothetical protein
MAMPANAWKIAELTDRSTIIYKKNDPTAQKANRLPATRILSTALFHSSSSRQMRAIDVWRSDHPTPLLTRVLARRVQQFVGPD